MLSLCNLESALHIAAMNWGNLCPNLRTLVEDQCFRLNNQVVSVKSLGSFQRRLALFIIKIVTDGNKLVSFIRRRLGMLVCNFHLFFILVKGNIINSNVCFAASSLTLVLRMTISKIFQNETYSGEAVPLRRHRHKFYKLYVYGDSFLSFFPQFKSHSLTVFRNVN